MCVCVGGGWGWGIVKLKIAFVPHSGPPPLLLLLLLLTLRGRMVKKWMASGWRVYGFVVWPDLHTEQNHKQNRRRRRKGEIIYLSLHCHHQSDSCIKTGRDESHFNVSLSVRDKVTRQCPQTTTFLKRKESRRRFEPRSLCLPA